MNSERVMVFIDNSNIFQGFKKYNIMVDYEKLKKVVTRNRNLIAIRLYEGIVYPLSPAKKKWYNNLSEKSGYIIKTTFNKRTANNAIEKKIDVKLAIDVVSLAYEDTYDTAVLVTGDGDFLPVVKKLKQLTKNIEIWAFRYSLAKTLEGAVVKNNVFYIDDVLSRITMD